MFGRRRRGGAVEMAPLDQIDDLEASGRLLEALERLESLHADHPDEQLEIRLAALRHAAFAELDRTPAFPEWPVDRRPDPTAHREPVIPSCPVGELSGEILRTAMLDHGCLLVPQLASPADIDELVAGIDRAFEVRGAVASGEIAEPTSWFHQIKLDPASAKTLGRKWVQGGSALLTADSPHMLAELFGFFGRSGLRGVLTEYLGERPVLSANKCTLRRVPTDTSTDWHQDGAFLGDGIRAVNVWVALSDCGVDAPGLDLVPRRFDRVLETGTGGAFFDWAVGPEVVAVAAREAPVVRPEFRAGDALIFDELFLHRTAVDAEMTRSRYAIESWFFAPSTYPEGQVPIVW
jgi:Phytanoyl-CoA dioxygenase (PhyH)